MEWLVDWLRDFAGWVVTGVGAFVAFVLGQLHRQATRISMLEQSAKNLPAAIDRLTATLEQSRRDREEQIERLHDKLEDVRKELKADIDRLKN